MGRLSSVDVLPEDVQAEIGRLRQNGRTIDEILVHLRTLDGIAPPSRSALGRHIQGMDAMIQQMRATRQAAAALNGRPDDGPVSAVAQANIEMLHTALFNLQMAAMSGENLDASTVKMLSQSMRDLGVATKANVDVLITAEKRAAERAKTEAATAVEKVARERGLSAATRDAIKASIFGVQAGPAA